MFLNYGLDGIRQTVVSDRSYYCHLGSCVLKRQFASSDFHWVDPVDPTVECTLSLAVTTPMPEVNSEISDSIPRPRIGEHVCFFGWETGDPRLDLMHLAMDVFLADSLRIVTLRGARHL